MEQGFFSLLQTLPYNNDDDDKYVYKQPHSSYVYVRICTRFASKSLQA